MTYESRDLGAIVTEVVQPLWNFGARRAEFKLTPVDNFEWCKRQATQWQRLLCDTVSHALQDPGALSYMGLTGDVNDEQSVQAQDKLASYIFQFVTHLIARKGSSLSRVHWKPPWSLGILVSEVCRVRWSWILCPAPPPGQWSKNS